MSRRADATPATQADIRHEVELIKPLNETERQCQATVLDWIDSGVQLCRLQKPATPPKHLIAYCVLVDGDHILLVDHNNAELWLPTGGHVDPGEHPRTTARREMLEELGIKYDETIGAPIMLSVSETVGKTAGHTDVSLWYVLRVSRSATLEYDQSEFSAVRWFHRSDIPYARCDRHMGRFVHCLYSAHESPL